MFHFLNYFNRIYRNLKEPGAVTESSEVVKENSFTNVIPSSEHPVDVWKNIFCLWSASNRKGNWRKFKSFLQGALPSDDYFWYFRNKIISRTFNTDIWYSQGSLNLHMFELVLSTLRIQHFYINEPTIFCHSWCFLTKQEKKEWIPVRIICEKVAKWELNLPFWLLYGAE